MGISYRSSILVVTNGSAIFGSGGVHIEGITTVGRATVHVLAMNHARRLELRAELMIRGDLP